MSTLFEDVVKRNLSVLTEAPTPPPSGATPGADTSSALPSSGGMGDALGGMGGGMGGGSEPTPTSAEMDDDAKMEADPIQFTKSVLDKLTKVTPEMFENFLNTYSNSFLKIKDKEQFKQYYGTFYKEAKHLFEVQNKFKSLFNQLRNDVNQLTSAESSEPDNAKGGVGKPGPSGPGV
jgi:hypothetical protein